MAIHPLITKTAIPSKYYSLVMTDVLVCFGMENRRKYNKQIIELDGSFSITYQRVIHSLWKCEHVLKTMLNHANLYLPWFQYVFFKSRDHPGVPTAVRHGQCSAASG